MIKLKINKPLAILSVLLFISFSSLGSAIYINPVDPPSTKLNQTLLTKNKNTSASDKTKAIVEKITPDSSPVTNLKSAVPNPDPSSGSSPNSGLNSTPTPSPESKIHQITVIINNDPPFEITVPQGTNHCQLLTKALEANKISSLRMEYSQTYQSYAVYQINNIGNPDQVFWTYKINNNTPPLGCSHVKTQNNDTVTWTYLGSI